MKNKTIAPVFLILVWILFIVGAVVFFRSLNLTLEEGFFAIYNIIKDAGVYGALFFIIIYVVRPLLFIIASPFVILCGFIFGIPYALGVFLIAEMSSITFSYFFGKFTGGKLVRIDESFTRIKHMEQGLRDNTFLYMLRLRLISLPFDLLNYISGILKIPFRPFFFGTLLGVMPYNIAFLTAGAAFYGENIQSFSDISTEVSPIYLVFAFIIFISTFVFSRILQRYYNF